MSRIVDMGPHEKCFILIGGSPLILAKAAGWIRENAPGLHIPDPVISRFELAAKKARIVVTARSVEKRRTS